MKHDATVEQYTQDQFMESRLGKEGGLVPLTSDRTLGPIKYSKAFLKSIKEILSQKKIKHEVAEFKGGEVRILVNPNDHAQAIKLARTLEIAKELSASKSTKKDKKPFLAAKNPSQGRGR